MLCGSDMLRIYAKKEQFPILPPLRPDIFSHTRLFSLVSFLIWIQSTAELFACPVVEFCMYVELYESPKGTELEPKVRIATIDSMQ
jgi:hypothetical protein